MEVLRQAILRARVWGWQGDVPAEQLADLMDAVHNIPSLLQCWDNCDQELLKGFLEDYEHKWAKSHGPSLRAIYEQTQSQDDNTDHDPNDRMRVVKCDLEVLHNAAHDAINIFVRDVLIPKGLVDPDAYYSNTEVRDSQVKVTHQVADMWKESQVNDDV